MVRFGWGAVGEGQVEPGVTGGGGGGEWVTSGRQQQS
jgi:hypothetical protein